MSGAKKRPLDPLTIMIICSAARMPSKRERYLASDRDTFLNVALAQDGHRIALDSALNFRLGSEPANSWVPAGAQGSPELQDATRKGDT